MKTPWVSRALYERVLEDLRKSEEERKSLLDRILGVPDPIEALAAALPEPGSKEAEDLVDPTTGKLTAEQMKAVYRSATHQPVVRTGRG